MSRALEASSRFVLAAAIAAGSGLTSAALAPGADPAALGADASAPQKFALVELFTSEGCSSCPPADELLAELAKGDPAAAGPVYCLSFHVDYWNKLGWRDPFSEAAYSRRQQQYAEALACEVITPQMIVGGTTVFLGSERERARSAIDAALKQPAQAELKLRLVKSKSRSTLAVEYEVSNLPGPAVLNVALVERGLSSKVTRGENGGRTLRHENVVRDFHVRRLEGAHKSTATADGRADDNTGISRAKAGKGRPATTTIVGPSKGSARLKLPKDLVRENASVIAYINEADGTAIIAANSAEMAAEVR